MMQHYPDFLNVHQFPSEILNCYGLVERDRDLEGLRDTYLDPASDDVWLLLREPEELLRVLLLLLLLSSLRLSFSLSPSIAVSNRLWRGPISPFSSKTCLFIRRGIMMSQTLSSVSNSYTNSSMKTNEYPDISLNLSFR